MSATTRLQNAIETQAKSAEISSPPAAIKRGPSAVSRLGSDRGLRKWRGLGTSGWTQNSEKSCNGSQSARQLRIDRKTSQFGQLHHCCGRCRQASRATSQNRRKGRHLSFVVITVGIFNSRTLHSCGYQTLVRFPSPLHLSSEFGWLIARHPLLMERFSKAHFTPSRPAPRESPGPPNRPLVCR